MSNISYVLREGRQIEVMRLTMQSPPSVRARLKFVQVPAHWLEKLAGEPGRVYDLALLLLQLNFRVRGQPVKLSNTATRHLNLNRSVKYRVLARLEVLGLVSVFRRSGAAPLVSLIL